MVKKNLLGTTGISVSQIGLGTVKFGRNQGVHYPTTFQLPSDQDILALLQYAQNLGINFLDTAPAYGTSEERLGKLLTGTRQNWILCTKVGEEFVDGKSHHDFSPAAIRHSVERSLRLLKTDYLDIVLVHSNGNDEAIIKNDAALETLNQLKKSGLIRAIGMSTKTIAGGKLAVDLSDLVMVTYNPIHTIEQPVIAYAHEKNKGVLIKKALASGHIDKLTGKNPVRDAMQFVLREPGVSSVIVGTLNHAHLQEITDSLL